MPQRQPEPRRAARLLTAASITITVAAVGLLLAVLVFAGEGPEPEARTASAPARPAVHVGPQACDDARDAQAARDPSTPWCTLTRALAAAPPGSDVLLATGSYPTLAMTGDGTDRDLRFRAAPGARPALAGAQLSRMRGIGFSRLSFTGAVTIRESFDVAIERSDFPSTHLYMRQSRRVRVIGNRFRDVRSGERALLAQGAVAPDELTTEDLRIERNTFDNVAHDAIAVYNGYRRVVVADNVITGVWRPEDAEYHSDAMQFMGGDGLTIRDNILHDNNHGILVKDGKRTRDLVVTGNLITGGGAGLQLFNAPGARVTRNTIWDTRFGTIFRNDTAVRGSTSVRLEDNILDQLTVDAATGARLTRARGNVFGRGTTFGRPAYRGTPNFADAGDGDFVVSVRRPGAGLSSGSRPPGAQARIP